MDLEKVGRTMSRWEKLHVVNLADDCSLSTLCLVSVEKKTSPLHERHQLTVFCKTICLACHCTDHQMKD